MFYGKRFEQFYDFAARSKAAATVVVGENMTVQSGRDEADINVLVRRFNVTRQLPQVTSPPTFGDFTQLTDYRSAQTRHQTCVRRCKSARLLQTRTRQCRH